MGHALENVYENDGYPFFFVSMVTDVSSLAYQRIYYDYNISGFPTGYWDGGYRILVGGYENLAMYRLRIEAAGAREVPELELSIDMTWISNSNIQLDLTLVNKYFPNEKPLVPAAPEVKAGGCIGIDYEFATATTDPDGHQIYYRWDYGDGTITDWVGPYNSGDSCFVSYAWSVVGTYGVKVQAQDEYGQTSDWSPASTITMYDYLAGDANGDLTVNILDITYIIAFLYKGGPMPDPYAAGDANGNVVVNMLDITYLISYKYMGGPEPVYAP